MSKREISEILKRVSDAGLETIRLSFADQHGVLRGKTLVVSALESALANGVPITSTLLLKDTSHKTVFDVWSGDAGFGAGQLVGASDVVMRPIPSSFQQLPWSPKSGWLLCDLEYPDGRPVAFSSREVLKQAISKLDIAGFELIVGLEVEFHVLKPADENSATLQHITQGFQYLTEDRYDQMEHIFDLVRENAQALGLPLRSLESEFGPSQCEVVFEPAGALQHADNMMLFRSMVKQVCRRAGYAATFMCRPKIEASMSNGWHLHQSLLDKKSGINAFTPAGSEALSATGMNWLAGILAHAKASCIFSTPTVNGYKRYQPNAMAPDRIQWGSDNKGTMVRVLAKPGDKASRIENRIGEPAANPYFYIASQILCGLEGIENKRVPPSATDSPYDNEAELLPTNLGVAIELFDQSSFYRQQLGGAFVDYLVRIKQAEWQRYLAEVSDWEQREYFELF